MEYFVTVRNMFVELCGFYHFLCSISNKLDEIFFNVNVKAFVKIKFMYIIDNTFVISLTYIFVGV